MNATSINKHIWIEHVTQTMILILIWIISSQECSPVYCPHDLASAWKKAQDRNLFGITALIISSDATRYLAVFSIRKEDPKISRVLQINVDLLRKGSRGYNFKKVRPPDGWGIVECPGKKSPTEERSEDKEGRVEHTVEGSHLERTSSKGWPGMKQK